MPSTPRISVLNLLLLAGAVCAFVALFVARGRHQRELQEANAVISSQRGEVNRLRAEQGHLAIHDKARAYAVRVETINALIRDKSAQWRCRIYLPELADGFNYRMSVCDGTIPATGFPDWSNWQEKWPTRALSYGVSGQGVKPGEHLIDFAITEDSKGEWRFRYAMNDGSSGSSGVGNSDWIPAQRNWRHFDAPSVGGQQDYDPLKPIPILRLAENTEGLNDDYQGLRRGVLVHFEPAAPGVPSGPETAKIIQDLLNSEPGLDGTTD